MGTLITPPFHRQTPPRPRPGLWWFVSLSLLLHLGLLWGVQQGREAFPAPAMSQPTTGITVQLVQRPPPPPSKAVTIKPRPVKKTAPKTMKEQAGTKPVTAAATPSEKAARPRQTEAPGVPAGTPAPVPTPLQPSEREAPSTTIAAADERAQQEQLKLTLQQALARHFRYPLLARKRGWQGEVLLAFRLEADGRIMDARIARSSGHGLLDRAALNALSKIKRIERGTHEGLSLQLPVIYRLEG